MKLYFSAGACSLAPHIILEELGLKYETVSVDLKTKTTAEGDYNKINPKGYVPALRLDDGQLLTEDAVILQYLADQKPELGLIPQHGTMERYRLMETLHFISTEIHKSFGILFAGNFLVQNQEGLQQLKDSTIARLSGRLSLMDQQVAERTFIMGDKFTIADAYLITVYNWAHLMKFDISQWPRLEAYYQRTLQRPSVQKAFKAEGLLK